MKKSVRAPSVPARRRGITRLLCIGAGVSLVVVIALSAAGVSWLRAKNAVEGFDQRAVAREMSAHPIEEVRRAFAGGEDAAGLGRAPYDRVAGHLLEGFLAYRGDHGSKVYYPGEPSWHGREVDAIEGFARMLPFAAAWLAAGGEDRVPTADGPVSLSDALRDGLVNGTDPGHPGYWGLPGRFDQRIVEASDIELGIWLGRDTIWSKLDAGERVRVLDWLRAAADQHVFEGTWQLFPVLTERVIDHFEASTEQLSARARTGYERFLGLYEGDGWYRDVPKGIDYYNAWAMHYALFWINQIDPDWDRDRIRSRLAQFAGFFRHLFGPHGVPIMGRSLCYRLALPAPLVAAAFVAPERIPPGEAMRALDATWSHFVPRGAVDEGRITQGICADDPALLDGYSGPGSCLWSLRSLVVAYYAQASGGMLEAPRLPLPVERGDFVARAPVPGWTVEGTRADGHVRLRIEANADAAPAPIRAHGTANAIREWVAKAPRRPNNAAALYGRPEYSTAEPLSACEARR